MVQVVKEVKLLHQKEILEDLQEAKRLLYKMATICEEDEIAGMISKPLEEINKIIFKITR